MAVAVVAVAVVAVVVFEGGGCGFGCVTGLFLHGGCHVEVLGS